MNCVEARDISVTLGGRTVLDGVDFALGTGELVGLIGPNGCGKTTLLRTLCGLESPVSGQVMLAGEPIARLRAPERARRIGYLPQHAVFHWPLTVFNAVALGRHAATASPGRAAAPERAIIDGALAAAGLSAMAARPVDELSGGEAMRVHIARLLAGGHAALVADEPVTSLDPRYQLDLLAILRRQANAGIGVVLSLHDVSLAFRSCDRIVAMQNGAIIASDTPRAVYETGILASVFDIEFEQVQTSSGMTVVPRGRGDPA